ncbi:hypothetical protein [Streptomyces sp. NPDC047061]|uniref:DUF485 domain-containing protein n=1 Tax=Streptomyces sp. NPDC047061 TaxID=3154605 RepID=UPI0033C151BE
MSLPFAPPRDSAELGAIESLITGIRRRFVVVNGGGFALSALLTGGAGHLLAAHVLGRLTVGSLLCLLQLTLLVITAWMYDRAARLRVDARVDRARAQATRPPHSPFPVPPGSAADVRTGRGRHA